MSILERLWPRRPPVRTADPATIRAFFNEAAADEEHYPSTIDPRILHVKVVLEHLGDLNGKRVADVGCGKGRFARIVKERNPGASVVALDLAEAMLRPIPAEIERVAASMTALPLATGSLRRRLCHRVAGTRRGHSRGGGRTGENRQTRRADRDHRQERRSLGSPARRLSGNNGSAARNWRSC